MAAFLALPVLATAAAVAPSAAAPSAADKAAIDAAVAAIFRPYRTNPSDPTAAWDRPIWSAPVRVLIAQWKRVMPEGEVDDLNDGDWLCQCQDWDAARFRTMVLARRVLGPGLIEATVWVDLGFGEKRTTRLTLRREGTAWRIDEMVSDSYPRGLRQAIRETIAADSKLGR